MTVTPLYHTLTPPPGHRRRRRRHRRRRRRRRLRRRRRRRTGLGAYLCDTLLVLCAVLSALFSACHATEHFPRVTGSAFAFSRHGGHCIHPLLVVLAGLG